MATDTRLDGATGLLGRLSASPSRALATLFAAHAIFFALLIFAVSSSPPLDVIEGLVWGQGWLIGTHKLPPLPSWMLEIVYQLSGSIMLAPFLLSQLCIALTYLCVFAIGGRVTSPGNALAGTLLAAGIFYFTWTTPKFNHDVVQMPIWAAAFLLLAVLRDNPRRAWAWLGLGLLVGLGVWSKYSVAVLYVVIGIWILIDAKLRPALATTWPWLAALVAIAVAAPHLYWLVEHNFWPLDYARARAQGDSSFPRLLKWLPAQALAHLPIVVLLLAVGRKRLAGLAPRAEAPGTLAFVAYMALAPGALMALGSVVSGQRLVDLWGMPMFNLSGLLIVLLLKRDWDAEALRRLLAGAVLLVAVAGIGLAINIVFTRMIGRADHYGWPMAELAAKAQAAWSAQTTAPLRYISGDKWIAGQIALNTPGRPQVVYDGSVDFATWIDRDTYRREGALYIWQGIAVPWYLIPKGTPIATRGSFELSNLPDDERLISYAIRLPVGQ